MKVTQCLGIQKQNSSRTAAEQQQGTQQGVEQEDFLFVALEVGDGTHDGAGERNADSCQTGGVGPGAQILIFTEPGHRTQVIEIYGHDGRHQKDERGVPHIVENPLFLQGRQLVFRHTNSSFHRHVNIY